jgi:hypothetical protein
MKRLLVTLGCSWTFGVGVGYTQNLGRAQHKSIAWDNDLCNTLSFRGLLSTKYNLANKNLSAAGSSNQKQFRLAKIFFSSYEFKKLQKEFDQIVVLWGITSTARSELFFIEDNQLRNFFYSEKSQLAKSLVKFSYDHQNEVDLLEIEMRHWNNYFENLNIKNLWFDTFNHHDYWHSHKSDYKACAGPDWPTWEKFCCQDFANVSSEIINEISDTSRWGWDVGSLPNLVSRNKNPRDLLSQLAINNGCTDIDNQYHTSNWDIDSNRVSYLVDRGILNPHSYHPTRVGHEQIANILDEYVRASFC